MILILYLCARNFLFISLQNGSFYACLLFIYSVKISCLFLLCDKHKVFPHLSQGWSLRFLLKCFDTPWNHTSHRNNYLLFLWLYLCLCVILRKKCSDNKHKYCSAICICMLHFMLRYEISSIITCCQSIGISRGKQVSSFYSDISVFYGTAFVHSEMPLFYFLCKKP